jgi:hypothetical protein
MQYNTTYIYMNEVYLFLIICPADIFVNAVILGVIVEDHLTFQAQQRGIPARLIVAEVQRVVGACSQCTQIGPYMSIFKYANLSVLLLLYIPDIYLIPSRVMASCLVDVRSIRPSLWGWTGTVSELQPPSCPGGCGGAFLSA